MMRAALRIALQELGNRGSGAERLQELNLGVGQLDEDDRHAVLRQGLRSRELGAEKAAIGFRSLREARHRDGDMIEAPDHTLTTSTWTLGFLPQMPFTAARTARCTAFSTKSASRRRGRGRP